MFLENRKLRHYIYDLNVHIRIHLSIPFHIRILSATVGKYPLNMVTSLASSFVCLS